MTDLRKAAEMALGALEDARCLLRDWRKVSDAYGDEIEALRQALAQPEQEPVAWMTNSEQDTTAEYMFSHVQTPMHKIPLYEAPPSKPWVSLTDDDIALLRRQGAHSVSDRHFKAIEALLKEKNT